VFGVSASMFQFKTRERGEKYKQKFSKCVPVKRQDFGVHKASCRGLFT